MNLNQFLLSGLIYLLAIVTSAPIAKKLGLGSILGFLLVGAFIGPAAWGLIGGAGESVKHFAEFGVIMMLYLVGLELEPAKLWALRKHIFGLGLLQITGTAVVITAASLLVAREGREAIIFSVIFAMSSTAIILQSLEERGFLKTPVGQSIFIVNIFHRHDKKILRPAQAHQGDDKALVDLAHQSRADIAKVFTTDRGDE